MSDKQSPICKRKHVGPIRVWRRRTQFTRHFMNYLLSCVHCIRQDDVDFHYLWQEYYNSQGYGGSYYYVQRWATEYVTPIPVRHVHQARRIV